MADSKKFAEENEARAVRATEFAEVVYRTLRNLFDGKYEAGSVVAAGQLTPAQTTALDTITGAANRIFERKATR